jgi:ABC-2 type transport system ATP-binding protein
MSEELAIDVRGVTKRFGGHVVVDNVSIQVRQGEIFGFLGPNGSGKTTFIRMLCGLLKADSGSGKCLGYDFLTQSALIKQHVGYMTQRFSFYEDLTVAENLEFVAKVYEVDDPKKAVAESLERLHLTDRRAQLAGELSGGWKQRLALGACLLHRPRLLLLDEPTAGVDPAARRDFWEDIHALAAEGLTFLITTHYMDEAERCHRLGYIAYGKLLTQGTTDEVIDRAGLTTYELEGNELSRRMTELKKEAAVKQAVAFGIKLHVSGTDQEGLLRAVEAQSGCQARRIRSGLEDVFIHLMAQAEDNYRGGKNGK